MCTPSVRFCPLVETQVYGAGERVLRGVTQLLLLG